MSVYSCDECRRSTSGNCGQHGMSYTQGGLVLNCAHGMPPHLPCAACGRGYPGTNTVVYPITDADVERIAQRVAELIWPDVHPEQEEG